MHILSGNYLFSDSSVQPSGYFLALTILFALLLVASIFAYWRRAKLASGNPVLRRVIRQAARTGMWCGAIGLILAAFRYLEIPYLSKPIYILLLIFYIIFAIGYFVYELSERYPVAVYQLEQANLHRRFKPAARPVREPQRQRPNNQRGKRRR